MKGSEQTNELPGSQFSAINLNKIITIQGGHNCDFSAVSGTATVNGNVVISNGRVTIEESEIN